MPHARMHLIECTPLEVSVPQTVNLELVLRTNLEKVCNHFGISKLVRTLTAVEMKVCGLSSADISSRYHHPEQRAGNGAQAAGFSRGSANLIQEAAGGLCSSGRWTGGVSLCEHMKGTIPSPSLHGFKEAVCVRVCACAHKHVPLL